MDCLKSAQKEQLRTNAPLSPCPDGRGRPHPHPVAAGDTPLPLGEGEGLGERVRFPPPRAAERRNGEGGRVDKSEFFASDKGKEKSRFFALGGFAAQCKKSISLPYLGGDVAPSRLTVSGQAELQKGAESALFPQPRRFTAGLERPRQKPTLATGRGEGQIPLTCWEDS